MLGNKHKNRLIAFSSIVCLEAGPPGQTLRAVCILLLSALERIENQRGLLHFSACSEAKYTPHNGCH